MLGPSMAKALYNAIENDIPDSAIDIKDLSQKSEITVLFLEIRIIGDKHINIYILAHRITNGNKTTRATIIAMKAAFRVELNMMCEIINVAIPIATFRP
jgi:hypothetical protein